mgnify:CR=1 FL=1
MLFTVKKENIIEGLQKAAGIIPTRAGAAYLRSLWIKAEGEVLTIMATDANIEFTGTYPADVKEPGLVGVNGRNFVDLVRRLPAGELRIRLDDATGTVILEQGRRTYKLPANDPTWFQSLAPFSSEGAVVWSGDFFYLTDNRTSTALTHTVYNFLIGKTAFTGSTPVNRHLCLVSKSCFE